MRTLEERFDLSKDVDEDLGKYLNGAHHIDIVVRIRGHDVHIEFDWVKELLK